MNVKDHITCQDGVGIEPRLDTNRGKKEKRDQLQDCAVKKKSWWGGGMHIKTHEDLLYSVHIAVPSNYSIAHVINI